MNTVLSDFGRRSLATVRGTAAASLQLLAGHFKRYRHRGLQDSAAMLQAAPSPHAVIQLRLVNATLRLRRFAYVRGVVRYRQAASRMKYARALRRNGGADRPAGQRRVISLLCPTRERVSNVRHFIENIEKTALHPERVELLFYIDTDDPQKASYESLLREYTDARPGHVHCQVVIADQLPNLPHAWNVLAERATGDLLMLANDDLLFIDFAWDMQLDHVADEFPDGIVCLYFDGGQFKKPERPDVPMGDFPIITRRWYELLGEFTASFFEFWASELWIMDIARRAGRLHPVPGVFLDHLHYDQYKSPYDRTYQRPRATRQKSTRDWAIYHRTADMRIASAERLKYAIQHAQAKTRGTASAQSSVSSSISSSVSCSPS
jgi:glycosyl transferase/beta-hydroxylase protein BlmF